MMEGFSSRSSGWGGDRGGDRDGGGWGGGGGRGGGSFGGGAREEEVFGSATTAGINFDKYDDIPISVSAATPDGVVPPPIEKFEEATNMPQFLRDNIQRCHFTRPTPVQKHSIGIVQANSDLMACAQTGSGKTGAFLIPAICNVVNHGSKKPPQPPGGSFRGRTATPQCVVMAPTRELVEQVLLSHTAIFVRSRSRVCLLKFCCVMLLLQHCLVMLLLSPYALLTDALPDIQRCSEVCVQITSPDRRCVWWGGHDGTSAA